MTPDVRNAILCSLAAVGAVLATGPVLEYGVNDDWSYTHTALELARTGRFVYNGWATAAVGFQAVWAAAFIKVFGFSFTVVRLSVLPFAAGCGAMAYVLGRRAGVGRGEAALAALTLVCSPLFVPVATSFMTDVMGLFFLLLSIWMLLNAIESPSTGRAVAWVVAGALAGIVGGTVRQVVWVAPLALLLYVVIVRRNRLAIAVSAALAWVATFGAVALTMKWFVSQPYSVPDPGMGQTLVAAARGAPRLVMLFVGLALTMTLMAMPVIIAAWPALRRGRAGALLVALLPLLAITFLRPQYAMAPWLGNLINPNGVLGGQDFEKPTPGRWAMWAVVSCLAYLALALLMANAIDRLWAQLARRGGLRAMVGAVLNPPKPAGAMVLTVFAAAYLALLVPRAATDQMYDRYVIPLLPCLFAPLLILGGRGFRLAARPAVSAGTPGEGGGDPPPEYRESRPEPHPAVAPGEAGRVPVSAWAALAVVAFYAIATTHDFMSSNRARLASARQLVAAGVPREQFSAGFEYDCWTQLMNQGRVNDPRLVNPPGAYRPGEGFLPTVRPRYVVAPQRRLGLAASDLPPAPYRTILPPYGRAMMTQHVSEWRQREMWANRPSVAARQKTSDQSTRPGTGEQR
ncbi:MAG: ArnT family glycosyltransferase [Tepidisphaeraceae bacterium]